MRTLRWVMQLPPSSPFGTYGHPFMAVRCRFSHVSASCPSAGIQFPPIYIPPAVAGRNELTNKSLEHGGRCSYPHAYSITSRSESTRYRYYHTCKNIMLRYLIFFAQNVRISYASDRCPGQYSFKEEYSALGKIFIE